MGIETSYSPEFLPLRPPFDAAEQIEAFLMDNQSAQAIAVFAVPRGKTDRIDAIERGAHLLLADAALVYTNKENPGKYRFLISLKFFVGDWTDSPIQLVLVSGILSENLPPGEVVTGVDAREALGFE